MMAGHGASSETCFCSGVHLQAALPSNSNFLCATVRLGGEKKKTSNFLGFAPSFFSAPAFRKELFLSGVLILRLLIQSFPNTHTLSAPSLRYVTYACSTSSSEADYPYRPGDFGDAPTALDLGCASPLKAALLSRSHEPPQPTCKT